MAKKQSKRELYYEDAQSLYVAGWDLADVEITMPVSLRTLKNWCSLGQWDRKRALVADHPKLIGEALKGLVKQKVKMLLGKEPELNVQKVDELTKIITLVERLQEQFWDERAAVVEVMSQFGDFVRRQLAGKKELRMVAKLMEKFFAEMEGA